MCVALGPLCVGAPDDCRSSCCESAAPKSALCQQAFRQDSKHLTSLSYKDREVSFGSQFQVLICVPLDPLLREGTHHPASVCQANLFTSQAETERVLTIPSEHMNPKARVLTAT